MHSNIRLKELLTNICKLPIWTCLQPGNRL